MSQSIWGATARTASATIRIPVDINSTSSPGYITGADIIALVVGTQTSNGGKFLTTDGTNTSFAYVTEGSLSLSDVTTGNVSTSSHGFFPKLPTGGTGNLYYNNTGTFQAPLEAFMVAVSDETTALTTGTAKTTFRMPYGLTLSSVKLSATTAPVGADIIVNVKMNGTTIFSTKIRIDAGSKTSVGSATTPVLSTTALTADAEMTVDIDQVGSTTAGAGLKLCLIGRQV